MLIKNLEKEMQLFLTFLKHVERIENKYKRDYIANVLKQNLPLKTFKGFHLERRLSN